MRTRDSWISFLLIGLSLSFKGLSKAETVGDEHKVTLYDFFLHPPYLESGMNNRNWNFGGDAFANVDKYLRLTSEQKSQAGWLWSRKELTSTDAKSWSVEVEFKVGHHAGLAGDGFAFWYSTEKEQEGPVFGNKNSFTGLGIFFDSYMNSKQPHSFPYIAAMIGDGVKQYDHQKDGKPFELAGCPSDYRNKNYRTAFLVKYVADTETLSVYTDVDNNQGHWKECFTAHNVKLPDHGYFGLTGMTGGVHDIHDILSVSVYSLDIGRPSQNTGGSTRSSSSSHTDTPRKKESSFLFNLLTIVILLFVVYVAWVYYQSTKTYSYKRF